MFSATGRFYGGKYKGFFLADDNVDASYLRWVYWNCDLEEFKRDMLAEELDNRHEPLFDRYNNEQSRNAKQRASQPPILVPKPTIDALVFLEIVTAGRKSLAKKYHPDVGGDNEKMKEINQTADLLEEMARGMI